MSLPFKNAIICFNKILVSSGKDLQMLHRSLIYRCLRYMMFLSVHILDTYIKWLVFCLDTEVIKMIDACACIFFF